MTTKKTMSTTKLTTIVLVVGLLSVMMVLGPIMTGITYGAKSSSSSSSDKGTGGGGSKGGGGNNKGPPSSPPEKRPSPDKGTGGSKGRVHTIPEKDQYGNWKPGFGPPKPHPIPHGPYPPFPHPPPFEHFKERGDHHDEHNEHEGVEIHTETIIKEGGQTELVVILPYSYTSPISGIIYPPYSQIPYGEYVAPPVVILPYSYTSPISGIIYPPYSQIPYGEYVAPQVP